VGDAAGAHQVGDEVRRVGAEGRGDHRDADQPPRRRAPGGEEFRGALSRPARHDDGGNEAEHDRDEDDPPVEAVRVQRLLRGPSHAPRVKSGKRTGALDIASEASLSGQGALHAAASYTSKSGGSPSRIVSTSRNAMM